jgi:hypothetical protein
MLGLFNRKPKLPAEKRPELERDERILAWADAADGEVVVATTKGLWLPGRGRLGWHEVHKAAWSGRELRITASEVVQERDGYTVVVDQPVSSYLLLEPGDVPENVRARVTKSVPHTWHHQMPGGGARIAARRVPGVNGLTWTVRYDAGTEVDSETVVQATGALVKQAKDLIALPQ